ncbi:hypothetical protein RRV45_10160 [Bacillus sp. DTU_2020_1000418_1_SI_GHA_SEK_038]|uniref:hypothetical protein n=1 Tax=Bacillus sp. DTU_2020_1000418_1_SI_GHA_SEK_038 TaxID=3077585 RepID=UPI0028E2379F|nr:hypothetical protein [Bacillus sp. DTU_2020_1000418_1_SI_GHA_SEK_038]WNS77323.1 hypothetical protein RRV45_10160 [Bacillus sp. DTU_2020_1000418_1_SI_GHA_SEK_038]
MGGRNVALIEQPAAQIEPNRTSDCAEQDGRMTQAIPEITTETTTEKDTNPFSEVIQYWNDKTNASYRAGMRKTIL